MAPKQDRSRIHLLVARQVPVVVILQRRRARLFHVVTVEANTRRIAEGSWFRGKLYSLRCDVSFDFLTRSDAPVPVNRRAHYPKTSRPSAPPCRA